MEGVCSREEFHRALEIERSRADRNERGFSLLLLEGGSVSRPAHDLIQALARRIRQIDKIGWFDNQRIGVILPYTSSTGACKLADDIQRTMSPSRPTCRIYTYPGDWTPAESGGEGDKNTREPSIVCEGPPQALFADKIPVWKRVLDLVGSLFALVFLSPLLLLVAVLIKSVSAGPVILRQKRIGHGGKCFTIRKFRTMTVHADSVLHQKHLTNLIKADEPMTKLDTNRDPRIIPLGNLIRRCGLDELPQLFNVLRGDMSLVGPRPCISYEAQQYLVWQRRRFDVVPGITGLWQVSGKNRTTFKEMIRLDIAYAERMSLWLDLRILLKTLPALFQQIAEAIPAFRHDRLKTRST